jgi:GTP-binding protein
LTSKSDSFFVDLVRIQAKAGDGGPGVSHFRREKFVPRGGPDGGDGGPGGDIILRGEGSLRTLLDFRYTRHYEAEDGKRGGGREKTGRKGRNVVLKVPLGTMVSDDDTGTLLGEVLEHKEELRVLKGGRGGRGNARFATSERRTPTGFEEGEPGQRKTLRLELKLLADLGLVGFPNSGKTTLLKALSGSVAKVGSYPFTTLTPNLGVMREPSSMSLVVVDIPGIIEGASRGRGMGLAFLRHIERTRLLIFLLDASGPDPEAEYRTLWKEIELYNPNVLKKPKIVVLNKIDLLSRDPGFDPGEAKPLEVYRISALKGAGIEGLKGGIRKWFEKTRPSEP